MRILGIIYNVLALFVIAAPTLGLLLQRRRS